MKAFHKKRSDKVTATFSAFKQPFFKTVQVRTKVASCYGSFRLWKVAYALFIGTELILCQFHIQES